jgi:hypothetical protein
MIEISAEPWPKMSFEQRPNGSCRGHTIEPFECVFLHDGTIGGNDGKHRLASNIG